MQDSKRYFDDFQPGDRFVSKGVTFTEADIISFALRYDPQPFHIDVEAARASSYGGLIASGFHTLAQAFRMMLQEGIFADCSMGSPGMDELRWLAPVRPGDTLRIEGEVMEARASSSKPDRGIVRMAYQAINQRSETVMTFRVIHLLKRDPELPHGSPAGA
ncbi:MAG: MaoC family dehydratase [Gammaproteobacteria bacterium]|nr:MaoC family dehydratase [Gammaproteobacteria bacterium]